MATHDRYYPYDLAQGPYRREGRPPPLGYPGPPPSPGPGAGYAAPARYTPPAGHAGYAGPAGHPPARGGPPGPLPRREPVGARGPPSGPRTNLSRADTGAVRHDLYVKVVTGGDPDRKSRSLTLEALQYVHNHLATFRQMGLDVRVNRIRSQDLQNARLVAAMQKRGITRLPALTTPNNVYLGFSEIQDIYDRNIREFAAVGRRGERAVEGAAPEDDLSSYYKDEMTFERAEEDAQEEGIGAEGDMMDDYRRMMERRERSGAGGRRPGAGTRPAPAESAAHRAAPPRPAHSGRPNNVGAPAAHSARPVDPEDAEIQETIERLARDIDDNFRSQAFSSGGGDSYDDGEGGNDFQDDLMEAAYWGNQGSSEAL